MLGAEESDAWYTAQRYSFITEEILEGTHERGGVGSCSNDVGCGEGWESGFGGIRMSVGDDLGLEFGENAEPIVGVEGATWWRKRIQANCENFFVFVAHENVPGVFACETERN